jgi:hypothetical protein
MPNSRLESLFGAAALVATGAMTEPGGRTVALALTKAGTRQARLVLAERQRALAALLAPLDGTTRAVLDTPLSAVLERLTDDGASAYLTCRVCDEHACAAVVPCPVDHAWQRRVRPC